MIILKLFFLLPLILSLTIVNADTQHRDTGSNLGFPSLRAGGRTRKSEFNESLSDGRFIFKSPSTKDHSRCAMWEAGSIVDIEWTCPKPFIQPKTVTIKILRIQSKTRKAGGYITIASNIPNRNWMNWTIPANFEQGKYFITIEDDEAPNGGYRRCMGETYFPYYFQVYLGRHYIGGNGISWEALEIDSAASSSWSIVLLIGTLVGTFLIAS